MSSRNKPEASFALSLVGGVLMLVGGVSSLTGFYSGGFFGGGMMEGFGGMMGGYRGMMGGFGMPLGFMFGLSIVGLVSGALVVVGAIMVYSRPSEQTVWGVIILIFSAISLVGMGGFFVGAVLGIVGGVLALTWSPASAA